MAARRMVPTRFFKHPDIMNLSSKDTQLILIGLILAADDEGREVAHAGLLGREMDYLAEQVETALQELVANDLLLLYQVGKHRYYHLVRWDEWQTLGNKKTPSKHPAPPSHGQMETKPTDPHLPDSPGHFRENSGKFRENPENSGKTPSQFKRTESKETEDEGETPPHGEEKDSPPRNVVPFPRPSAFADGNADDQPDHLLSAETRVLPQHVAHILQLPVTEALTRLVAEYTSVPGISLPGEADAAREWIDDPHRNKKHRRMSVAFFRNWLKREQDAIQRRQIALQQAAQATGTGGPGQPPPRADTPAVSRRPPNLMHLADEDQRTRPAQPPKGDHR